MPGGIRDTSVPILEYGLMRLSARGCVGERARVGAWLRGCVCGRVDERMRAWKRGGMVGRAVGWVSA